MKVKLTSSFQRDFKGLNSTERERACDVILKLPAAIGRPHLRDGVGIRKLHASGIFEARLGLDLRLLFAVRKDELILHRLGRHGSIRKFLANL